MVHYVHINICNFRTWEKKLIIMWILNRYIGFSIVRGFIMLALILVSLFAIIILIEELEEVGDGNYTWFIAIEYVLLNTPKLLLEFAAIISLIGTIVALGALAGNHEIVAAESLGISPVRVTTSVVFTALILMIFVLLVAQFVIPVSLHKANIIKTIALEGGDGFVDGEGYWAQKDNRFLHVNEVRYGRIPANVEIYEFNKDYKFLRYIHAEYVEVKDDDFWELHEVKVKEIVDGVLSDINLDIKQWNSFLNAKQVDIIISSPETLSITNLYRYVQSLKQRNEQFYRYELLLWQKIMVPVSAILMILLGMRFVFGSQRSTTMGKRVTLGVLSGIAFYVFTQLVTHWGTTNGWNSILIAIMPNLLVLCLLTALTYRGYKKIHQITAA